MSIENQIERINQNISNTYTELEALGADAPDVKNSENLAATVQSVKAILYTEQNLTEDQKEQARKNIGLDSLDTTLTQSGKAADAKATGDEIKRVEGLIPSIEGLAKEKDIPKVPNWSMQASKPSYTADEVGALPKGTKIPAKTSELTNDSGFQTEAQVTTIVQQQLGVIENGTY